MTQGIYRDLAFLRPTSKATTLNTREITLTLSFTRAYYCLEWFILTLALLRDFRTEKGVDLNITIGGHICVGNE